MTGISDPVKIQIGEFKRWLEREATDILHPFHKQGQKITEKIHERLEDVRENCENLADEAGIDIERGKTVRKAKVTEKLCKYFLKQIDEISFPTKMSFNNLDKLHKDLREMFVLITRERHGWFPRISPIYIIARKKVDFSVSKLDSTTSELSAFLSEDGSNAKIVEELFSGAGEILSALGDLGRYEERRVKIEEKVRLLQKKIEQTEKQTESIQETTKLGNLAEAKRRIKHQRKQIERDFRHLKKPFMKFANLLGGPGYNLSSEEAKKLDQYLEDPYIALATEKSGIPLLRSILQKIEQAMDQGKLKLKSSRLRKAREKIHAVLNEDAFADLYRDCERVFSTSQRLVSSKETKRAKKKLTQLLRQCKNLRRQRKAAIIRLGILDEEYGQLTEKVESKKSLLETSVYQILKKRISLMLPVKQHSGRAGGI